MNLRADLAASLIVALFFAGVPAARAEGGVSWQFSGFGTVGVAGTNTDDAQFHSHTRQTMVSAPLQAWEWTPG